MPVYLLVFSYVFTFCNIFSVNSAPEDFSVKPQMRVSRDLDTSTNMKESEVDPINEAFDLTPNSQPTDLRFNMYVKRSASPSSSIYRNNPDPYLGSGSHNGGRNSNGSGHSGQEEFDLSVSQSATFTAVSADLTPSLPSYMDSNEHSALGSSESYSRSNPRSRLNSGPSGKFELDQKLNSADFRPSATNSFTVAKNNSISSVRRSPISASSSQNPSTGVASPLSPCSYNASSSERSSSINPFSASALGYKSSAFKPLSTNQAPGSHYSQHASSPYHHGPNTSIPNHSQHIPGYISPATGSIETNMPPNAYPNQGPSFEYVSGSSYKRKQTASIDNDPQNRSQTGNTPPNQNPNQGQNASDGDQNKRVIVPAGKSFNCIGAVWCFK